MILEKHKDYNGEELEKLGFEIDFIQDEKSCRDFYAETPKLTKYIEFVIWEMIITQ